jgi:hypothetical protein
MGQIQKAMDVYETAMELAPDNDEAKQGMALVVVDKYAWRYVGTNTVSICFLHMRFKHFFFSVHFRFLLGRFSPQVPRVLVVLVNCPFRLGTFFFYYGFFPFQAPFLFKFPLHSNLLFPVPSAIVHLFFFQIYRFLGISDFELFSHLVDILMIIVFFYRI